MTKGLQPIGPDDIMINVYFHRASGHFTFTQLTEEGKVSGNVAEPEEWGGWSDYMEPGEFYEKLKELFGV